MINKMINAAKIIGTGLARVFIGAGVGMNLILRRLLISPPKPHVFASTQLNSGFSFN